jgi:hypothetical protein
MKSWPWNLNNIIVHSLVISPEGVVTRNVLKYLENTGLTKKILRVGQKQHYYKRVIQNAYS